jgi:hypothetical protein
MPSPKELSKEVCDLFSALVPYAERVDSAAFQMAVQGRVGRVRVKRAAELANQVHVCDGEPLVVYLPNTVPPAWYVVPVAWQLDYARKNPKTAAQHASHAFDCMMFKPEEMDPSHRVQPEKLLEACEKAIFEARDPVLRMMLKAITRARDAVTNALIDTIQEGLDE